LPDAVDPEIAHRYSIEFDSVRVASFSECSGLQVETEVEEVQVGGLNAFRYRLPKSSKYGNLVLRRGLGTDDLWDWHQKVVAGTIERKTVSVVLLSPDGNDERWRWTFKGAFPVKWTGPDLKATTGAVAIETLELAHHGVVGSDARQESGRAPRT